MSAVINTSARILRQCSGWLSRGSDRLAARAAIGGAGIDGLAAQFILDAQQLVVLGHALAAAEGAGLDLAGARGHRQVGDGGVLGFA